LESSEKPEITGMDGKGGDPPNPGTRIFSLNAGLIGELAPGGDRGCRSDGVFNFTNHPFGPTNEELRSGSADCGTIRTAVSAPRQMQFGLKFVL
jgi:hypothetical protein